jgi:hypothetical protein
MHEGFFFLCAIYTRFGLLDLQCTIHFFHAAALTIICLNFTWLVFTTQNTVISLCWHIKYDLSRLFSGKLRNRKVMSSSRAPLVLWLRRTLTFKIGFDYSFSGFWDISLQTEAPNDGRWWHVKAVSAKHRSEYSTPPVMVMVMSLCVWKILNGNKKHTN